MRWFSILLVLSIHDVYAAAAEPLPSPLTLEHALQLSQQGHPVLQAANAHIEKAKAGLYEADAISGTRIGIIGQLARVEPPTDFDFESRNDSSLVFNIEKRLYDFGHTAAARKAASLALSGTEWHLLDVKQQRYLSVMSAFFNVILADLEFSRDNEAMATAFVRKDRIKERQQLGQASDIEFLEKESVFQAVRHKQRVSETRQRATRSRLAIALNRPAQLSDALVNPPVPDMDEPIPTIDDLTQAVLENSPELKGLRAELEAADQSMQRAKTHYGPVLSGEFEAGEYNRVTRSSFPLRAALVLNVPLYTGGLSNAEVAKAQANVSEKQAQLDQALLNIRQTVLDLWLELETLRVRVEEIDALDDYRDLYLDRSRALYEMEVTAYLGDAMVQASEVKLRKTEAQFQWMLARARLDALTGNLLPEPAGEAQ